MMTKSVYRRMREIVAHDRNVPISARMRGTPADRKMLALMDIVNATLFEHRITGELNGKMGRYVDIDSLYQVFSEDHR